MMSKKKENKKLRLGDLTEEAKEGYFSCLEMLERLPDCIASFKTNFLLIENGHNAIMKAMKIFLQYATFVFRILGYSDTLMMTVSCFRLAVIMQIHLIFLYC